MGGKWRLTPARQRRRIDKIVREINRIDLSIGTSRSKLEEQQGKRSELEKSLSEERSRLADLEAGEFYVPSWRLHDVLQKLASENGIDLSSTKDEIVEAIRPHSVHRSEIVEEQGLIERDGDDVMLVVVRDLPYGGMKVLYYDPEEHDDAVVYRMTLRPDIGEREGLEEDEGDDAEDGGDP